MSIIFVTLCRNIEKGEMDDLKNRSAKDLEDNVHSPFFELLRQLVLTGLPDDLAIILLTTLPTNTPHILFRDCDRNRSRTYLSASI